MSNAPATVRIDSNDVSRETATDHAERTAFGLDEIQKETRRLVRFAEEMRAAGAL